MDFGEAFWVTGTLVRSGPAGLARCETEPVANWTVVDANTRGEAPIASMIAKEAIRVVVKMDFMIAANFESMILTYRQYSGNRHSKSLEFPYILTTTLAL